MTDITQESLQKKQEAIDLLAKRYRGMEQRTEDIDLRRIVKGGPQPTHKIDLVHGLLDALYGFDLAEGRVSE